MSEKSKTLLLWSPRVLAMLFAAFLLVFSFDSIIPGAALFDNLLRFFMQNIPVLIIIAIIFISWSYEITGGAAFVLVGVAHIGRTLFYATNGAEPWYSKLGWSLIIAGPAVIIGVLYLFNWRIRQKALADVIKSEEEKETQE